MILELSLLLQAELKEILQLRDFVDREGKMRKIPVHRNRMPRTKREERNASETDPIPFALLAWFGTKTNKKGDLVDMFQIDIAVREDSDDRCGADDLMVMCDQIIDRFCKNPLLWATETINGHETQRGNIYRCTKEFEAVPQMEDTKRYFAGGMLISFERPPLQTEGMGYA